MAKAKTPKKSSAAKKSKKPAPKKAAVKKAAPKKAAPKKAAKAPAKKTSKAAPAKKAQPKMKAKSNLKAKPTAFVAPAKAPAIQWENFLTPLDDRLIVETATGETMTAGGLYIPATVSDVSGNSKGKVLIAGRGHRDAKGRVRPMDVKTGDTIVFAEFSGSKMKVAGKDVLILRESEVLGIVDKNK